MSQQTTSPHHTKKRRGRARRDTAGWLGPLLLWSLSLVVLAALTVCVRPETAASARTDLDLSVRVEGQVAGAVGDVLGDLTYIPKHYVIPEGAAAPSPSEAAFGVTDDPAALQAVIDDASELLDGQRVVFDPNVKFQPKIPIRYYRDDTILVIAWREIIGKKLCTFAEVKIADPSQMRRKLAGDAYGSSTELYATDLAAEANAVVAINGDFYIHRTSGVNVWQRQVTRFKLADQLDSCFFTSGGDMLTVRAGTFGTQEEAQAYVDENDVTFGVTFGPTLVEDGQTRTILTRYPLGQIYELYSRSVFAQVDDLHYLLLTINMDGYAGCEWPCNINEAAQIIGSKGVQAAYAMDGGQTAIIAMQGEALNNVDFGYQRTMSDIICFTTALPEDEQ